MSALAVSCPTCLVGAGYPCVERGRVLPIYHPDRIVEGRQIANAAAGRQPPAHRGAWRDRRDQGGMAAAEQASDAADFDLERLS